MVQEIGLGNDQKDKRGCFLFRCPQTGQYVDSITGIGLSDGRSYLDRNRIINFVDREEAAEEKDYYEKVYQRCSHNEAKNNHRNVTAVHASAWQDPWKPHDRLVLDALGNLRGKRIVLLGNGDSAKELWLLHQEPIKLVLSDLSSNAVKRIRDTYGVSKKNTLLFVAIDALELPLPDQSVDVVYAYSMVHHLRDVDAFLREVARVLVPGGYSVFLDDAYSAAWNTLKQTFLHPLMNYSHRKTGISPEDYRFSMSGGFREEQLAEQIESLGCNGWFKRCSFITYLWHRGVEKLAPRPVRCILAPQWLGHTTNWVDGVLSLIPLYQKNLVRLVWGIKKPA